MRGHHKVVSHLAYNGHSRSGRSPERLAGYLKPCNSQLIQREDGHDNDGKEDDPSAAQQQLNILGYITWRKLGVGNSATPRSSVLSHLPLQREPGKSRRCSPAPV
jgi:hypothetical protein